MQTEIMNLSDIDISDMIQPRRGKLNFYRDYMVHSGIEALIENNSIVVNQENKIIDGYCTYLLLSEQQNPKERISVLVSNSNNSEKVIIGRVIHKKNIAYPKEYKWKYKLRSPVKPGDIVLSEVENHIARVIVTGVMTIDPAEIICTKKVIKKIKYNNQMLPA